MNTTRLYGKKTDIALGMWVKLARAFATMNRLSADDIRTYGITQAQFGVLEALGHLGPMTLGQLSRKMLISCGNTTVIADNLEKEELLERVPHPGDRRATVVRLTPKGQKLFIEIFPRHAAAMTEFASALGEREQARLSALLKKLGLGLRERYESVAAHHTSKHTS